MTYENIEFTYNTFCIGPQAGTYCFVNYTDLTNVLLQVKNSSGVLIRNYAFLPADVFYTNSSVFPYNIIVDLKYVGPRGRPDFFNGAIFYTMERVMMGFITLPNGSKEEYSDRCVIRKWSVDKEAFTLILENTFYINSDETYYFDAYTFSVQHQQLSFLDSVTTHTEEISVSNTDALSAGDILQLGPSSDVDNTNDVELIYIHSIDDTTVQIRSFDGVNPTRYEYVIGDPITYIGDVFLISNPRPILTNNSGQDPEYGDGRDGSVTITASSSIINNYDYVVSTKTTQGLSYIIVNDGSLFEIGQEILIHQSQDAFNSNEGVYEFKTISYINVNTILLTKPLYNTYYSGTFNALESVVTQVVSVPNYSDVLIQAGAGVVAKNWDGYSGGIVVFKSNSSITIEGSSEGISANYAGFRGGGDNGGGDGSPGDPGEGYTGLGWQNNFSTSNCLANFTGGGGGYGPSGYGGTAGGGGGNRTAGTDATDGSTPPAVAQGGGITASDVNRLLFGGAGGGGGDGDSQTVETVKGGNGGGIIVVKGLIVNAFYATASGEKGTNAGGTSAGTGGGGAGGVIVVDASTYYEDRVYSSGGAGGTHDSDTAGKGGEGYIYKPSTSSSLVLSGYADNGNVYRLNQQDYCSVIEFNENAKYTNVQASVWNITTGGLSMVKVNNYMTIDVDDGYTNIKSQIIKTLTKDFEVLPVYALDYYDTDLYFLQKKVIKLADDGTEVVVSWSKFNYVKDSIIPYGYSTNILTPRDILVKYTQIHIEVVVRDQFNVGVLGSNVFFTYIGDPASILDPLSGYVTTDVNGSCYVTFTSGAVYQGATTFRAKSDKGSTNHGSQYTNCYRAVEEYVYFIGSSYLTQIPENAVNSTYISQFDTIEGEVSLSCFGKYIFGEGSSDRTSILPGWAYGIDAAIVQQILEPLLAGSFSSNGVPQVTLYLQQLNSKKYLNINQLASTNDTLQLSQMTSSRHLDDLNKDQVNINQFVFIQDAIPPFWEEKVTVNTYIWIRLRPFAYSLDPTTLIFLVKEVNSYIEYDSGYIDVTELGQVTLYDAGGGMFGVDFFYQPARFFTNESIIYVDLYIKDTAPIPNSLSMDYWFKIIDDYRGPVIYNISPPKDSVELALDTVIEFYVADYGIGIDINSVDLFINDSKVVFSYEYIEEDVYKITYDLESRFNYGTNLAVNVAATDNSKFSNTTYEFWTLTFVDSTGPLISMDNATPHMCKKGVSVTLSEISFQIYSIDGTGVDVDSISTSIDGKYSNIDTLLLPVIYHIRK